MPILCPHGHTRGMFCPHCSPTLTGKLFVPEPVSNEVLELQAQNQALRDQLTTANRRIADMEAEQESRWN